MTGITDGLDQVGNTTAAIGKGFAIGSAALTALALFAAFTQAANIDSIDITKTNVVIGMFLGGVSWRCGKSPSLCKTFKQFLGNYR